MVPRSALLARKTYQKPVNALAEASALWRGSIGKSPSSTLLPCGAPGNALIPVVKALFIVPRTNYWLAVHRCNPLSWSIFVHSLPVIQKPLWKPTLCLMDFIAPIRRLGHMTSRMISIITPCALSIGVAPSLNGNQSGIVEKYLRICNCSHQITSYSHALNGCSEVIVKYSSQTWQSCLAGMYLYILHSSSYFL